MANVNPIMAGLRLRCGQCGKGKLFRAYLKLKPECEVCGRDMSGADTADGPAFFVGFFVLILLAPIFVIVPLMDVSGLVKIFSFIISAAVMTGLSLWLLPIAKAVMLNLQLHHGAMEATFDDSEDKS